MQDYTTYADLGPAYYADTPNNVSADRIKREILRNYKGEKERLSAVYKMCDKLAVVEDGDTAAFDEIVGHLFAWADRQKMYLEVCHPGAKRP